MEGISSFLGIFDQPEVARVFCPGPPAAGEVPEEGATFSGVVPALLQPLPRLRELIENGTVLCLNMPAGTSPALARAVGVMLKGAWLQAALRRPADMAAQPDRYWRPAVFVCDEYQSDKKNVITLYVIISYDAVACPRSPLQSPFARRVAESHGAAPFAVQSFGRPVGPGVVP